MLASPLDHWIGDEDTIGRNAIAVDDNPMLDPVVVADDELAGIDGALEALEVEVVAEICRDPAGAKLADDRGLPGAAMVGAEAFV